MKRLFAIIILALAVAAPIQAQEAAQEPVDGALNVPADFYYKGEVVRIVDERELGTGSDKQKFQTLAVKLLEGPDANKEIEIADVGGMSVNGGKGFAAGDIVVVNQTTFQGESAYYVVDTYRLPRLIALCLIFLAVILIFSRMRGLSSILGLAITVVVIVKYVSPQIMSGKDPLVVTLIAAIAIAITTLYLAHGINRRTTVAVASTLICLGISVGLSTLFVSIANLYGNGTEEAIFLQLAGADNISLRGLLLAGIILGALGVLDDITTAQSATVDEVKKANPSFTFHQLYAAGSSVGKEHISSLINTLFLAYAGASLPLFLLFSATGGAPIWVTLNAEFIAEEIVRTLVGSITLILAVPITTLLAAWYFDKAGPSKVENQGHTQ